MRAIDFERFKGLNFSKFKSLAEDRALSKYEKIGFPDDYRRGSEGMIFRDITRKLKNLTKKRQVVVDIGSGCTDLPLMLIDLCRKNAHQLVLIDSAEMLSHLPDEPFIRKVPAYYPDECRWLFEEYAGRADAILIYSVLQYVFTEGNLCDFLDRSIGLLAEGGQMLIGDIPNISKRKRLFISSTGIRLHREFTGTDEAPEVGFHMTEAGQIDDAVLGFIINRCRLSGFDAYWLPQDERLPMANRREDVLVVRP